MNRATIAMALAMIVSTSGCGSGAGKKIELRGAGASFPALVYSKWFKDWFIRAEGIQVSEDGVK